MRDKRREVEDDLDVPRLEKIAFAFFEIFHHHVFSRQLVKISVFANPRNYQFLRFKFQEQEGRAFSTTMKSSSITRVETGAYS